MMLKFTKSQFRTFETATQERWADQMRPELVREFGASCVAEVEPLSDIVDAAVEIGMDTPTQAYRLARVMCTLSLRAPDDRRHALVARCAHSFQPSEDRLTRMERAALGDTALHWADTPDGAVYQPPE